MNNLFSLAGKTALVTGGAQGLGRMIATGLIEAGAKVYITSRGIETAQQAAAEMSAVGECVALAADLRAPDGAKSLSEQMLAREQRLDILVNNAGRTWGAPLEQFPDKAWNDVMAVNVQAPFALVRDLLPLLKAAGTASDPARVINIGSLAGSSVEPIQAYSYAASKAAIHHLSKVLAAELAGQSITVNALVPGYFPTRMTAHVRNDADENTKLLARVPLNRLGEPQDIAGACIFLASRAGSYITGTTLFVDGGMTGCR